MDRKYIARVWVDDNAVYAETTDGLRASYEFAQWPRLRNATAAQRQAFELSYGGIHWPDIDEDLSFEGMFHVLASATSHLPKMQCVTSPHTIPKMIRLSPLPPKNWPSMGSDFR